MVTLQKLLCVVSLGLVVVLGSCAEKPTVAENRETTISGKVLDAQTNQAIANATVRSEPVTEEQATNADGGYVLRAQVEVGTSYRVTASAAGYGQNSVTIEASEGENRIADIKLFPALPEISVTPDSLYFEPATSSVLLIVENTGSGELNWDATASEGWIEISRQSGTSVDQANTITVTVDRTLIDIDGIFSATIAVTSNAGTVVVPIQMEVEGKTATPRLSISPVTLPFGLTSSRQTIGITNTGNGDLTWQISPSHSWISVSQDSGITSTGTTQITIQVDRAQLSPGEHNGSIDIVSSGGGATISITVSLPTPVISISTREVDFRSDLDSFELTITNIGTGDLGWSFGDLPLWMNVDPAVGTTGSIATTVRLRVDRSGLEAKEYDTQLLLSSNAIADSEIAIQLKMQVLEIPSLGVSADSLDFGTSVDELVFSISNTNNGTLSWEIESDEPWIVLNVSAGEVGRLESAPITITIARAGLPEGVYEATLTVASDGGRATVYVVMEVLADPRLSVNMQTLSFGETLLFDTIELRNSGTGRLTWDVSKVSEWLSIAPQSGTALNESDTLVVRVNREGLTPGQYQDRIQISSDGGNREVLVEMTVADQPVLSISSELLEFGTNLENMNVGLKNEGNVTITWSVLTDASWISINPIQGDLIPGDETFVSVDIDRTTLEPGEYEVLLLFESNGAQQVVTLLAQTLSTDNEDIVDPVQWSGNEHYYELVSVSQHHTWDEARSAAESRTYMGLPGHLVTIQSAAENSFVLQLVQSQSSSSSIWIGGFQPSGSSEPIDNWTWVTGEPWEYNNWDSGSPDDAVGNQNHLVMLTASPYRVGYWADARNDNPDLRPFVVEYGSSGDARIIGEVEEDTEEDTGDARIIGEVEEDTEEDTGDARIIGEVGD